MRRSQITITYPAGEAQQLHQVLLLPEKKPSSQCVGILSCGDCREAGKSWQKRWRNVVKSSIRISGVEMEMMKKLQTAKKIKSCERAIAELIKSEYYRLFS